MTPELPLFLYLFQTEGENKSASTPEAEQSSVRLEHVRICDQSRLLFPLLQVSLLMHFEVSQHGEGFPTLPAAVRLQPAVEALVPHTVVLPGKGLATDGAAERPLARVHALVRLQPGLLGEGFAATLAPETFGGMVQGLVLLQLGEGEEALAAHGAEKQSGICSQIIRSSLPSEVISVEELCLCTRSECVFGGPLCFQPDCCCW